MTRRNHSLILRYYKPNKNLLPEKFSYHLMLLFYQFVRDEGLFSKNKTYLGKLQGPMVCVIVTENNKMFEPNGE